MATVASSPPKVITKREPKPDFEQVIIYEEEDGGPIWMGQLVKGELAAHVDPTCRSVPMSKASRIVGAMLGALLFSMFLSGPMQALLTWYLGYTAPYLVALILAMSLGIGPGFGIGFLLGPKFGPRPFWILRREEGKLVGQPHTFLRRDLWLEVDEKTTSPVYRASAFREMIELRSYRKLLVKSVRSWRMVAIGSLGVMAVSAIGLVILFTIILSKPQ